MFDHLLRDFQILQRADFLIGRIWLNVLARRFSLLVFAGLIAVFGLGMANVAGFYALQDSVGAVRAATIIAVVDFAIAGVVLLIASRTRPGPEIDLALDVRKMALDSIKADAQDLKQALDAVGQELKDVKANVTALVRNPLDVAAQKVLIPTALSLLKGLRSRKEHA